MEVDGKLTELGTKYHTDKAYYHKFTRMYERYLYDKRNKIQTMVEVGVLRGASIKMWDEYLPNAKILGLDINSEHFKEHQFSSRVNLEVCDASKKVSLEAVLKKHNMESIDLFIEDGSHRVSEQVSTLDAAWKYIKSGGIYVIEDMHTAVPALIGRHAHIPHDGGYINVRPTTEERVLVAMYGIEGCFDHVPVNEIDTISYISNVQTRSLTCILTKV